MPLATKRRRRCFVVVQSKLEGVPRVLQTMMLEFLDDPADFAALFSANKRLYGWNSYHFRNNELHSAFRKWLRGIAQLTRGRKKDAEVFQELQPLRRLLLGDCKPQPLFHVHHHAFWRIGQLYAHDPSMAHHLWNALMAATFLDSWDGRSDILNAVLLKFIECRQSRLVARALLSPCVEILAPIMYSRLLGFLPDPDSYDTMCVNWIAELSSIRNASLLLLDADISDIKDWIFTSLCVRPQDDVLAGQMADIPDRLNNHLGLTTLRHAVIEFTELHGTKFSPMACRALGVYLDLMVESEPSGVTSKTLQEVRDDFRTLTLYAEKQEARHSVQIQHLSQSKTRKLKRH